MDPKYPPPTPPPPLSLTWERDWQMVRIHIATWFVAVMVMIHIVTWFVALSFPVYMCHCSTWCAWYAFDLVRDSSWSSYPMAAYVHWFLIFLHIVHAAYKWASIVNWFRYCMNIALWWILKIYLHVNALYTFLAIFSLHFFSVEFYLPCFLTQACNFFIILI